MAAQEVTSRKLAGAIRRAKRVYVYVVYNEAGDGAYVLVAKTVARAVVEHARDFGHTAAISETRGDLYIG
jgi:hypothetical protein